MMVAATGLLGIASEFRQGGEAMFNFRQSDGAEIPAIRSYIEALGVAGHSAMRMAEEGNAAAMGFVPHPWGVVEEDDKLTVDLQLVIGPHPLPSGKLPGTLVVITPYEVLAPIQAVEKLLERFEIAKAKIAQAIEVILGTHSRVPIRHHGLVHMSGVAERTVAIFDDVGVKEVVVGSKVDHTPNIIGLAIYAPIWDGLLHYFRDRVQ